MSVGKAAGDHYIFSQLYTCCAAAQSSFKISISSLLCLVIDKRAKNSQRCSQHECVKQRQAQWERNIHGPLPFLPRESQDISGSAHCLNKSWLALPLQFISQVTDIDF